MHQTKSLITLRLHQLIRLAKETGIGITLLAIFLLTGSILSFIETALEADPLYAILGIGVIIIALDRIRNDKPFIKQIFGSNLDASFYLFIEYSLIVVPLLIYKIICGQYLIGLGLVVLTATISLVSPYIIKPIDQGYKKSINIIPLKYFELKFFAEKSKITFLFIPILLMLGIIHVSLWILGIFIFMGLIIEMFSYQEPMEMIHWDSDFVGKKILAYALLFLPILVISSLLCLLNSELSIWVFVYGSAAILVATGLAISNKYANYYGFTEKIPSPMPMTIIAFLMLLPGFIIVTLGYTILKYKKAEKQMKLLCSK